MTTCLLVNYVRYGGLLWSLPTPQPIFAIGLEWELYYSASNYISREVDSTLETLMICMGHYENKPPIYEIFIEKNK